MSDLAERLNWLHCLVQELENDGISLPMGDYTDVYGIIEDARELLADVVQCNTCGDTGRWESTTEEAPTVLVDLGPCPDCWRGHDQGD